MTKSGTSDLPFTEASKTKIDALSSSGQGARYVNLLTSYHMTVMLLIEP